MTLSQSTFRATSPRGCVIRRLANLDLIGNGRRVTAGSKRRCTAIARRIEGAAGANAAHLARLLRHLGIQPPRFSNKGRVRL